MNPYADKNTDGVEATASTSINDNLAVPLPETAVSINLSVSIPKPKVSQNLTATSIHLVMPTEEIQQTTEVQNAE